jgi:hypothetical protein
LANYSYISLMNVHMPLFGPYICSRLAVLYKEEE